MLRTSMTMDSLRVCIGHSMIKWLLLILLAVGVYLLVRRPARGTAGPVSGSPERMVSCAACGIFLPEKESIRSGDGTPYCCEAHRTAGPR